MLTLPTTLLTLSLHLRYAYSIGATNNATLLKDNSQNCSCYVVQSGDGPQYFQYHRFYDFRNVATRDDQYTTTPPLLTDSQDQGDEDTPDQEFLNSTAWNSDWGIQNWGKEATSEFPVRMQNSPGNVFIVQNNASAYTADYSTYLALRTSRLDAFQSAAEIENEQKNVLYASLRFKGRVVGDAGAVAGFFTFYDDSNESDIEILTDDPKDMVRYTNQPSVDKDGNQINASSLNPDGLPGWDEWRSHRIDWLDGRSFWSIEGEQVANNTYSVPRKPSGLTMNMWSDGGEWSGNMSVGGWAEFHVQWVEMVFNTSGEVGGPGEGNKRRWLGGIEKRESKGCEVVCRVDGVKDVGFPEVAHVSSSGAKATVPSLAVVMVGGLAGLVALAIGL